MVWRELIIRLQNDGRALRIQHNWMSYFKPVEAELSGSKYAGTLNDFQVHEK
jgi:hypothetical protein